MVRYFWCHGMESVTHGMPDREVMHEQCARPESSTEVATDLPQWHLFGPETAVGGKKGPGHRHAAAAGHGRMCQPQPFDDGRSHTSRLLCNSWPRCHCWVALDTANEKRLSKKRRCHLLVAVLKGRWDLICRDNCCYKTASFGSVYTLGEGICVLQSNDVVLPCSVCALRRRSTIAILHEVIVIHTLQPLADRQPPPLLWRRRQVALQSTPCAHSSLHLLLCLLHVLCPPALGWVLRQGTWWCCMR